MRTSRLQRKRRRDTEQAEAGGQGAGGEIAQGHPVGLNLRRRRLQHLLLVRLGYPLAVVLTQGTTVTRLFLDGTVTTTVGAGAPTTLTGEPGVVAMGPTRITAVLPAGDTAAGNAALRLEATFGDKALHSNTVSLQW